MTEASDILDNTADFAQFLIEYRCVLMDILNKSQTTHQNVMLSKCKCGYSNRLNEKLNSCSNYVKKLEVKYQYLMNTGNVLESDSDDDELDNCDLSNGIKYICLFNKFNLFFSYSRRQTKFVQFNKFDRF